MKLKEIIKKTCIYNETINVTNFKVKGISINSNDVKDNYIFGAVKGNNFNGEDFISKLSHIKNLAVILSKKSSIKILSKEFQHISIIKVDDVRLFISVLCSILFPNNINQKLAVTGTNGKTSVASYVYQIWQIQMKNSASLGTLGLKYKKKYAIKSNLTTPDPISNHKLLNYLDKLGCDRIIFEASSIGIHQKRLYPTKFNVIAFTNLSIDHMDYHKTMTSYKNSKSLLFSDYVSHDSVAVLNADSKYYDFFLKICKKKELQILDYGKRASFLKIISIKRLETSFEVKFFFKNEIFLRKFECHSEFEIYNKLCSLIMVFKKTLKQENFGILSKIQNPDGRLEEIFNNNNQKVFIDYAHTPDAISRVLSSLRKITLKKLIIVFGCGGDRDNSKRNLMTKEALRYSDYIVITDDNPRFENPKKIREQMVRGIPNYKLKKIIMISNRSKAIGHAVKILSRGDTLLIAGKGHEEYQIIKNKKIKFSDKKIAMNFLKKK